MAICPQLGNRRAFKLARILMRFVGDFLPLTYSVHYDYKIAIKFPRSNGKLTGSKPSYRTAVWLPKSNQIQQNQPRKSKTQPQQRTHPPQLGSFRTDRITATVTKTSLQKWIRATSNFIALIPTRSIRPEIFLQLNSKDCIKVQKKKKKVVVLHA